MKKLFVLFAILCAFATAVVEAQSVTISSPNSGSNAAYRQIVSGTVNPNLQVWVVVHPLDTSNYWVQPKITVQNKKWDVVVYLGRQGNADVGKLFEIRAVASPKDQLWEGKILSSWPTGILSNVVTVKRGS